MPIDFMLNFGKHHTANGTEEEFKIFCEAETLSQEINKAYIELKLMRK